jgi:type VII secretion-associated serine protease mycosin
LTLCRRLLTVVLAATVGLALMPEPVRADNIRDQQWHLGFLNVAAAHKITQGDGVLVGLTDTGVDTRLPDLAGVVVDGTEIGETGNGRKDTDGHGTAMAGLIAGRGSGPSAGVLGIAPKASILSVRTVLSGFGGSPRDLGLGTTWAIQHGAKVICIAAVTSDEPTVKTAIEEAIKADVVVVAGVGNLPDSPKVGFPANLPGVLAVGGVDKNGKRADISTTGPEVAIVAPAVDIVSTSTFGEYRRSTGTSDATAIVAGAVALVRARYPDLSAPEVIHRLTATATDKGPPGRDPEYGYGILDLVKALTADVPPAASVPPSTGSAAAPKTGNRTAATVAGLVVLVTLALVVILAVLVARRSRNRSRL